jgi:transcription termination/antitermination protein NusG
MNALGDMGVSSEPSSAEPREGSVPEHPGDAPAAAGAAPVASGPPANGSPPGDSQSDTHPFPAPEGTPPSPEMQESAADEPELDEPEEEEPFVPAEPLEFIDESHAEEDLKFDWYILKVQVNREDSIKDALLRRVKMEGKEPYFREIIVPTEDMAEFTKTGKRKIVKKKIYPGYILVNMSINDETWFLVRETPGIGDFTGSAGKPTPMLQQDVDRILRTSKVIEDDASTVRTAIPFKSGDRVRVKEGYFQNFEGDVDAIDQANGRVTVMINIFGRSTPVELEHWQIEKV